MAHDKDIHVTELGLGKLHDALEGAGEDYKEKLVKLTNLINEIVSGDIQCDPANDLVAKFEEKRDIFYKIAQTIDEAEEYAGLKHRKFDTMVGDLHSEYK